MKTELLKSSDKTNTIQKAVYYLQKGQIIAIPTETVYGLACDFSNSKAIEMIYELKGRDYDKPLPIALSCIDDVEKYVDEIPQAFYSLAKEFLPGPLSIVLKKKDILPALLTSNSDSVNIRIVQNEISNSIIKALGRPIALTSANKSKEKSCTNAQCVMNVFKGLISAIIDDGQCKYGQGSTIISLISTIPKIIRKGIILKEDIEKVLGYSID